MKSESFFHKALMMYVDGFRSMTVGRKLWAIILIKLAIMFLVFRLFFFPDRLAEEYDSDADRAEAVRRALTGTPPTPTGPNDRRLSGLQSIK